jgi:hypothetical protein
LGDDGDPLEDAFTAVLPPSYPCCTDPDPNNDPVPYAGTLQEFEWASMSEDEWEEAFWPGPYDSRWEIMTKPKIDKLLALVKDCSDEELAEVRRVIDHILGLRRSIGVLSNELERPGRRGRRWKKKEWPKMNSLKEPLANATVIVKENTVTGTTSNVMTRIFKCESGLGCYPQGSGATIRGRFLNNPIHGNNTITIDGSEDIERKATAREVLVAQS